jgi:hypothetical protein
MFLEGNFSSVEAFYPAFDLVHSEYVTKSIALPVYGKRGNRG